MHRSIRLAPDAYHLFAHRLFARPSVPTNPESDARYGSFDFRAAHAAAPADLQELLDQHESLPFRRRGYERDGMLKTVVERAGERAQQTHTQAMSHRHSHHHFPTPTHPQASKSCSEPPNQAQAPRQRCSQQCLPK